MATMQIPAILLESLEVSLEAQGKLFLRDISKVLDIPYKDLLKNVYGGQLKVPFQLTEVAEDGTNTNTNTSKQTNICRAIIPHYSAGYMCKKPCQNSSSFCEEHFVKQPTINVKTAEPIYNITATLQDLYVKKDLLVMNKEGLTKGFLDNGVYYEYTT